MESCRFFIRFLRWHLGHTLPMTVHHVSTYPELPRKSALRRYFDNLYIFMRDGSPCAAYDGLGLDIAGRPLNDFISNYSWLKFLYRRFHSNEMNAGTPAEKLRFDGDSQTHLLTDKYCFWSFLERHEIPVVPILAHTVGGVLYDFTSNDAPLKLRDRLFVKPANSSCGNACCVLSLKDGKKFYAADRPVDLSEFTGQAQDYIFQPVIENHADIKALNPGTLNTLRIVTCRTRDGRYELWNPGMIRIGRGNAVVDNFAKGGIGIGIAAGGTLKRYGYSHDADLNYIKMDRHPDSQLLFEGRKIPFYEESVDLVLKAHTLFSSLQTIGWDIAVTPDGPILLEGNQSWDIEMLQVVHHEGFIARVREIYGTL